MRRNVLKLVVAMVGTSVNPTHLVGTAAKGYRLHAGAGKHVVRLTFTPFFNDEGFFPWDGASIGYSLLKS